MHSEGVPALRGCDKVLAKDFGSTCPDQKKWLSRLAGTRLGGSRSSPTLAHTFRCVEYTDRPEYFTMYGCVYGMVRSSMQWLKDHEGQLQEAKRAFLEEHGFQCAPAVAVAMVRRSGAED